MKLTTRNIYLVVFAVVMTVVTTSCCYWGWQQLQLIFATCTNCANYQVLSGIFLWLVESPSHWVIVYFTTVVVSVWLIYDYIKNKH